MGLLQYLGLGRAGTDAVIASDDKTVLAGNRYGSTGDCAVVRNGDLGTCMGSSKSAGILLCRRRGELLEVFLVHPGGPYWARKDNGAWSIPKGEYARGEDALAAAQREFTEETGFPVSGPFKPLRPVKQSGGKVISAWAAAGDLDPSQLQSNSFALEWPPKSGTIREYPEVDRGAWFSIAEARIKLIPAQRALLEQVTELV
jgi:predicted NUDIX family NTP pyrophosphohydrolase